jgi:hypothetical protein
MCSGLTSGAQFFCCHFSAGALRWQVLATAAQKKSAGLGFRG